MSNLQSLEALGCYLNAGYLDHHDGRHHTRIGSVDADGEITYTDVGRAYADKLVVDSTMKAMTVDETPVPEPVPPLTLDPALAALIEG